MVEQFGRTYKIQIGPIEFEQTLDVPGFTVDFKVAKTKKKEPNTMDMIVYNLNETSRRELEEQSNMAAQISAGYAGENGTVYFGEVREVRSYKEPPDWITEISSGDGEEKTVYSRVNKSFSPGVKVRTVIEALVESLGIGRGNLADLGTKLLIEGSDSFQSGIVVSGQASKQLDRVLRSINVTWSIQDGELTLLSPGRALNQEAVLLTPQTGLVGSPTVGSDGRITFASKLNSEIFPGRQIKVETSTINEYFLVEDTDTAGNSLSGAWTTSGTAKQISAGDVGGL